MFLCFWIAWCLFIVILSNVEESYSIVLLSLYLPSVLPLFVFFCFSSFNRREEITTTASANQNFWRACKNFNRPPLLPLHSHHQWKRKGPSKDVLLPEMNKALPPAPKVLPFQLKWILLLSWVLMARYRLQQPMKEEKQTNGSVLRKGPSFLPRYWLLNTRSWSNCCCIFFLLLLLIVLTLGSVFLLFPFLCSSFSSCLL